MTGTSATKNVRYKQRYLQEGQQVRIIEPVQNGLIHVKKGSNGKIVYNQSQVEASVWVPELGVYHSDPINKALQCDTSFHKSGRVQGLVLNLKAQSFAILYDGSQSDLTVSEEVALALPFFEGIELAKKPSNYYKNGVKEYIYYLEDVKTQIDDKFADWVEKFEDFKYKLSEQDKEDDFYAEGVTHGYPTDIMETIRAKKDEVEISFAKATGVYVKFDGGLIWE